MSLRDYPYDSWARGSAPMGANGRGVQGPLVSPVKAPKCDKPTNPDQAMKDVACIEKNTDDLAIMISMLTDMLAPNNPPKGSIPLRVFGQAAVAAVAQTGAGTQLLSTEIIEGYAGYITAVQCIVDPEPASIDVQFSVKINNKVVPNFDQYVNSVNNTLPVTIWIPPTSSVQVLAKNVGTGGLICGAVLIGWLAPIRRY